MRIVIDKTPGGAWRTMLTDGEVIETIRHGASITGNIYKGRVIRRLEQFNALSVDIGESALGFLPVDDVNAFTQGDEFLVQAATDGTKERGAKLSLEISLPGFAIVLLIGKTRGTVGVSKNISDDEMRMSLKRSIRARLPRGMGAIVRTDAEYLGTDELAAELDVRLREADALMRDCAFFSAPRLLLDASLPRYAICRLWKHSVDTLVLADDAAVAQLPDCLPGCLTVCTEHSNELIDTAPIKRGETIRATLPCGGNIVIDRTEALTVIDVNSGSCDMGDKTATIATVNREAAREIARRLRLHNIAGMVIIDFIDPAPADRESLAGGLAGFFADDTAKVKLFGFTAMGMFELTRKPRY